ncbi:hypothetical protein FOL01_0442 [Weissella jogaejeotgali]|uniref:Uncharacterized protein n=1 Tax=Weissella jogaejeotgali TaxID=1631871 RepID=A0A1L6R9T5_9LACO|nr:hypothetical protein FOL01_0442 [Weissella jogaejeotgali]
MSIPKYVVFNTNKLDRHNRALPTDQGDDLNELLNAYHGKAYQIMKVRTITDREEW